MCTVTYFPLGGNNFVLTSNRDETPLRKTISPKEYIEKGVTLIYPKDVLAGGTWIGLSEKKRLVCLLNGAFVKHQRKEYYKMSRGLIVKMILIADNFVDFIKNFDFLGIEPFTIILVDWNKQLNTFELVWDGKTKHFIKLPQEPRIWSSSALYNSAMKETRKNWFTDWLGKNAEFDQQKILEFHKNETLGTEEISIKMKRTFVETVSVTSIKKDNLSTVITYLDFLKNVNTMQKTLITQI